MRNSYTLLVEELLKLEGLNGCKMPGDRNDTLDENCVADFWWFNTTLSAGTSVLTNGSKSLTFMAATTAQELLGVYAGKVHAFSGVETYFDAENETAKYWINDLTCRYSATCGADNLRRNEYEAQKHDFFTGGKGRSVIAGSGPSGSCNCLAYKTGHENKQ